jgi:cytochrome b pre-mRNA-processing protein 3
MILPLFRRSPRGGDTISGLYGAIVAQARSPAFYRDYGVPDTLDGRFELILVHLALVLRRLGRDRALRATGQDIFDLFCADMERNLREIGVSDLQVPKEMERIGAAFYGRKAAYDRALAATGTDDAALLDALARNVYAAPSPAPSGAGSLVAYMRQAEEMLDRQDAGALMRGELQFPRP